MLAHLIDGVVVHESIKRGRVPDAATVEMRWRSGGVVLGLDTVEEWVQEAVAVASDADQVAQEVAGGLGLGEVVEQPWRTWPGLPEETGAMAGSAI